MNPLRLRAANYRTFEQLDLELPAGCVGVLGLNGAGKSSVVNAIDLALFGPESRSWAPYLTVGDATELMIELEFEHAGETYRVRRGFSARGAGKSTLDLEREGQGWHAEPDEHGDPVQVQSPPDWEALTLGSAKETQALLEQILGFSRRTLRASSLLLQGDGAAFTEADPRDRKKILADTLGLDRFDQLLAAVRRDRRASEQTSAQVDGRLAGVTQDGLAATRAQLEQIIASLAAIETASRSDLDLAQTALEQAAQAVQTAKEADTARAAMKTRVDAAAAALAAKGQLQRDAITAEEQAALVRAELEKIAALPVTAEAEQQERDLVAVLEQHAAATRDRDQLLKIADLHATEKRTIEAQATATDARMRELDAKVAHIELGELDSCPTCEQQLGAEARKATIGSLRAQAQTLADEAAALFERAAAIEIPEIPEEPEPPAGAVLQLAAVRETLRAARDGELQHARLQERLDGYAATIERASEREYLDVLAAAEKDLHDVLAESAKLPSAADLTPLDEAATAARGKLELHRQQLATAQQQKAVEEERLAQHAAREEQVVSDLAERERCQSEIDLLAILERAYGPDGIPALIVENAAIPAIEVEANRILVELAGTTAGCRVELRTDRAKQDGGVRDDVLDVVVITEAGERDYSSFSGGERTRLNLALRIALARLLATRRGAESRLLAIDEPEFLDEDGTAALVDVLRDLEQQGVFDRIYLVSHVPALRDSFDVVLQVVKDEQGRSRVEG